MNFWLIFFLHHYTDAAVSATTITYWLRENGYLEKRTPGDIGREVSFPTRKGEDLGMYTEKAGIYPNIYYRIFYNEQAQRFLIENFRKILTESEQLRERNRREKKSEDSPRSKRQGGNAQPQPYGAGAQPQSAPPQPYSAPPQPYNAPAQPYNEPDQMQDLPQEYYDMLSKGWDSSGDDVPW